MSIQNKDGSQRRTPTDNQVIKYGGQLHYKGHVIDYKQDLSQWTINDEKVENISQLSTALSRITKDAEFNRTTHKIGRLLETNGYHFHLNFHNENEENGASYKTHVASTFIITYNPAKWDEVKIQALIKQLNDGKIVIERWKFGSHKKCKVGDRVFLSRVGQNNPGLIGSGFIVSLPRQEPNFEHPDKLSWYVDVQFDYLSSTPDTVVVDHDTLSKVLNVPKNSFTPQLSGTSFKGNQALLEEIWQSFTGIGSFQYAEEISEDEQQNFSEGAKQKITVNKYERDPKARAECIRIHGYTCRVCNFDFEQVYGELGREYIHVHHLVPLKDIGEHYTVNPDKDMIPVCPNCHAMLHKLDDPGDVAKLKKILNR